MKCSVCGAESSGKFCPACGNQMNYEAHPTESQIEKPTNIQPSIESEYKRPENTNLVMQYWKKIPAPIRNPAFLIATIITVCTYCSSVKDLIADYEWPSIIIGIVLMWSMLFFGIKMFINRKKYSYTESESATAVAHKKAELDASGVVYCPKCLCTSISADKKGFGIGKAVVGSSVIKHPIGLVAGNIGAKKVRCTCLKCGYSWIAGTR